MAFWGGFMPQDGDTDWDLWRAHGWLPTQTPVQVTWPIYIYTAEPGFDFATESLDHLESKT